MKFTEDSLIEFLKGEFKAKKTVIGIGDDCAIIPSNGKYELITTDALVEGIHFLKETISPEKLGFKSITVNVSDIAAKGGIPEYAFLTLSLPKMVEDIWIKNFILGVKSACERYSLQLVGGDTVGSKNSIFISITLTGSAKKVKLRNEAKFGDVICVTNFLGDSLAGLKVLELGLGPRYEKLVEAYSAPNVYPEQGQWLAKQASVHAMMDVSDGLDSDLRKLTAASHSGAIIDIGKLPLSSSLLKAAKAINWHSPSIAVTGGEDYCLLCTVEEKQFSKLQRAFQRKFSSPLYPIGHITDKKISYEENGIPAVLNIKSYRHF